MNDNLEDCENAITYLRVHFKVLSNQRVINNTAMARIINQYEHILKLAV